MVGPTIGVYSTDNLTWRWVFYVNVPVGILAIAVVFMTLPSVRHSASWRDIDFAGAFALAATVVPLIIALSITNTHDFTSPEVLGLLLFAAVLGVIFFIIERRTPHPIVPFDLWRNPTFAVSTIVGSFFWLLDVLRDHLRIPSIKCARHRANEPGLLITLVMVGLITAST